MGLDFDSDDDLDYLAVGNYYNRITSRQSPAPPSYSPTKKQKMGVDYQCMERLKRDMPEPLPFSLREKSAQALAVEWSANRRVQEEMDAMESGSSEAFKMEVAVHLKGKDLAVFLRSSGGLIALMDQGWPELAQRLLTAVYRDMSRFNQNQMARQDLSLSLIHI